MKKLANLPGKNIFFTAIKINDETKKMFEIMEKSFGTKFSKTDSIIPTEFFDTMFNTATKSI